MNFRFLLTLAAGLAVCSLPAQTVPFYINDGVVQCPPQVPPQIDALNFVNNGSFSIQTLLSAMPYATQNTLNFTNRGTMDSSSGFLFMTQPDVGGAVPANSFYNSGTIHSGDDYYFRYLLSGYYALPQTRINARTVMNPGTISLGSSTLLSVAGENVDLNRATLLMSSSNILGGFSRVTSGGMFDSYWGMGKVEVDPAFSFNSFFAYTPLHWVTNRYSYAFIGGTNLAYETAFYLPTNTFYLDRVQAGSNIWTAGVFLRQSDPAITNTVYINARSGWISVGWSWAGTDPETGAPITNSFYLRDMFGSISNMIVLTNGYVDFIPTFRPTNYLFSSYSPLGGVPAPIADPSGLFEDGTVTNDYAAYEVFLLPNTVIPGETFGSTVENLPGRVELSGSRILDLTRTRVSADNTILLRATNHFIGSRADIAAPFVNLDLATTNGFLAVSNLIAPSLARPTGTISLFSTRWEVTQTNGFTNHFFVLLVDSQLQPTSRLEANMVQLRSPNVVISDYLNILSNVVITATNLTVTTNAPGARTPYGALNIENQLVSIPTALPRLQNLTNFGVISTPGTATFAGLRSPPWYPTTFTESYRSLVNRGWIFNLGMTLRADEFINSGWLDAGPGSIELFSRNAWLSGGTLSGLSGDISLLATNAMQVNNLTLTLGRTLNLSAGTRLDDGTLNAPVNQFNSGNSWSVGRGFNLTQLPVASSLLGTTIASTAPAYQQVPSVWAGLDKGTNVFGYQNNAALGRLLLTGGINCSFAFTGPGTKNAIYVDRLELTGYAAAKDANNDLLALDIAPNFRIYYAEALVDGISQAEKLNGRNDGRLIWVSAYAGFYSSTNLVYPDGSTNAVNLALALSCNLDSDKDGLVNCIDPTPVLVPSQLGFQIARAPAAAPTVALSWFSTAGANNVIWYKAAFSDPAWVPLTNFVTGASSGRVTALRTIAPQVNRLYRVTVEPSGP
jgi:hypothetical protein